MNLFASGAPLLPVQAHPLQVQNFKRPALSHNNMMSNFERSDRVTAHGAWRSRGDSARIQRPFAPHLLPTEPCRLCGHPAAIWACTTAALKRIIGGARSGAGPAVTMPAAQSARSFSAHEPFQAARPRRRSRQTTPRLKPSDSAWMTGCMAMGHRI